MPTANRRWFVPQAIHYFQVQDYPNKELLVLDDGEQGIAELVRDDPQIRYVRLEQKSALGAKRNLACKEARGDIIVHWDDDDWMASWRLSYQVRALIESGATVCGLDKLFFYEPATDDAWQYVYPDGGRFWAAGATLCYLKSFWREHPFPHINVGEDTRFLWSGDSRKMIALSDPNFYVAMIHPGNTCPKQTIDSRYHPSPASGIRDLLGDDWSFYAELLQRNGDGESDQETRKPAACTAQTRYDLFRSSGFGHRGKPFPATSTEQIIASSETLIGVHVYEQPDALHETVGSLRAHTPPGARIVLLGDGPDPATTLALSGMADIPQLISEKAAGAPACFNRLIGCDANTYVFLESGSIVTAGWLDRVLEALNVNSSHGLAGPSTNRAWNQQMRRDAPSEGASSEKIESHAELVSHHENEYQLLEPLYSLSDFCIAVKREVVAAIGAADEHYRLGPCWEMDYSIRAGRAGYKSIWACRAYVHRRPLALRRTREEFKLFQLNKRRYQGKFCRLKLESNRPEYCTHCEGDACDHFAPAQLIQLHLPLRKEDTLGVVPTQLTGTNDSERLSLRPRQSALPASEYSYLQPGFENLPLVSCIMPTHDRRPFVARAIEYFFRQDYPNKELIIIDDGDDAVSDLVRDDSRVRYLRLPVRQTVGAMRNRAVQAAHGEFIVHWDDDDWYSADRLSAQIQKLGENEADITVLAMRYVLALESLEFYRILPELHARLHYKDMCCGTIAYRRALWERYGPYQAINCGEDVLFLRALARHAMRFHRLSNEELFVCVRHASNTWQIAEDWNRAPRFWQKIDLPRFFPAQDYQSFIVLPDA
jgi:glycosyltransferase involved in cell wall biosynthesis